MSIVSRENIEFENYNVAAFQNKCDVLFYFQFIKNELLDHAVFLKQFRLPSLQIYEGCRCQPFTKE